ncbi:MAG TPA: hypothetical protein PLX95_00790, partial [bacterium]|nr:hypothetical protein [bacterium]
MIPIITVDSKGRVISASSVVVTDLNTTYTASNGLTLSGTEVQLGGTLSKSTSVLAGNYDMIFNLSGTGAFRIQSSGTDVALVNDMGNTIIGANLIVESPTTDGLTLSSNIVTNETGMYERVSDQTIISYNYNDLGTYLGSARSMYIGSSGSVGIGTTNPGLYKLNVAGSFIATDYFSGDGTLGAEYSSGGLVFKDGLYTGGTFPQETTFGTVTGTGVSGQVSYWDGASSQTGSNNLWFTGTKLGIGTTAPSQELDVVGDIELSNYLYFGNGSTEYLRWDGSDFILSDDFLPLSSASLNLGSDAYRWGDLYLDGATLHIGSSTASEGLISYASNILGFETSSTAVDIAFFTDDLYIDKSLGYLGIGTTAPDYDLDVLGTIQAYNFINSAGMPVNDILLEEEVRNLSITAMTGSLGLDMAQFVEKVSETTFNAGDTSGTSGNVLTAHFPNGNVLIAYRDVGDSSYGKFVIYDSAGNVVKAETTFKADSISWPSTTILQNGNILITYGTNFPTVEHFVIYDSAGNEVVSETTYNEGGAMSPSATTLTNGNVLIAYRDTGDSSYGKFVIYDSAGNVVKAETTFSATDTIASVATLTNGNVLIAYGANSNGYFIILDSMGKEIVSETIFNTGSVYTPSLKTFNNGNILIAYRDGGSSSYGKFVIYDSSGNLVKPETTFNSGTTTALSTTNLTNGNILIAYQDWSASAGNFVIYDSVGNLVKPETTFHASSIGNYLSVTTLTNGNVLIAYIDSGDSNYGKFVIWGSSGASFANLVGIGTTNPLYKLDVFSSTSDPVARFSSSDDLAQILLSDNDTTGYLNVKDSIYSIGLTSGLSANNLNINSSGNIGIGTTAPSQELDVVGDIELNNYLYFGNGSTEYLRWDGSDFIL